MNAALNQAGRYGWHEKTKCVYLSPAPADFSYSGQDSFNLIDHIDDVCLVLDNESRKSIAGGIRKALIMFNGWTAAMFFLYIISLFAFLLTGNLDSQGFATINLWLFILWAPMEVLLLITLLWSHKQSIKLRKISAPIIFNRQRREVLIPMRADAYESKRVQKRNLRKGNITTNFVLLPWDQLEACITKNTVYSGHGMMSYSALVFGGTQPEKYGDFRAQIVISGEAESMGLILWQYLYKFMEHGPGAVPEVKYENVKSAVEIYHQENREIKQRKLQRKKGSDAEYKWRRRANLLSCFSLPYYLADHIAKQPRTELPDWVKEWKKSLPESEWAKRKAPIQVFKRKEAMNLLRGI